VDIVHHACIGGAGFVALAANGQELAGIGFLVGSAVPDLDVALIVLGKRTYLRHHQGPTHSLPLAPLYAGGLMAVAALGVGWHWSIVFGLIAGMTIHVLLDLCNTFGIQLLWPFTKRRYCLDAVFFIDTVAWTLTAIFLAVVLAGHDRAGLAAVCYAALLLTYLLAKFALRRRVGARVGADFTIPSAWNPFCFLLLTRRAGRLETAIYNAWTGQLSGVSAFPEPSPDVIALARRSPLFRDLECILRDLHITHVDRRHDGTTIIAQDVAVRNFGGKFGRTELRFDASGRLLHEMADI
jgi:membrane-bound metal-dependent hydrolase YbcI (DUF457 family)